MKEWRQYRLIDILDKIIDYRGKTPQKTDSGIPLITAKIIKDGRILPPNEFIAESNYDNWMVRGIPHEGDVVLTVEAPLGEVAQLGNEKIALAQRVVTLRGKVGVLDNTFLKYFLMSQVGQARLKARETGTTVTGIKQSELREVLIDCPDYEHQLQIASILRAIDNKIENNRQINDNLEQQAQALYKSWFVDFEPFKDGEFIESELGKIPEGWQCIPFSMFVTESKAKTGKIGIKEYSVTNNGIFPRDAKYNKSLSQSSTKNKLILYGDLVFGMSRDILNWGVMQEEQGGVSSAYTVYNINSGIVNSTYLELFIKSRIHLFSDLIRPAAREGQGIDKSVLQTKVLLYPPQEVLDTFWPLYNSVTNQIQTTTTEINCLGDVRDTLLPKLMSGELKINEIDC